MAAISAHQLLGLLLGEEIRQVIRSEPRETQHMIVSELRNLLDDISPGPRPPPSLFSRLRQRQKPEHLSRCETGPAPENTRWVCILCPNKKHIKTRTNDLRTHLQSRHSYEKADLDKVFDPKSPHRLWEHFGPCTEKQASDNGWNIRSFSARKNKKKAKSTAKALAGGLQASISKGVQNMKAMSKIFSATSESALESSMEGLKLQTGTSDMEGSTVVPYHETASNTRTSTSLHRKWVHSPQMIPIDGQINTMTGQSRVDSLGLGEQFGTNASNILLGSMVMDGLELNGLGYHIQDRTGGHTGSISSPTRPIEINDSIETSPSPSRDDPDFHDFQWVDADEFEKNSFPHLFTQELKGRRIFN